MTGRSHAWIALLSAGMMFPLLTPETTEAQGLIQRIRDRVESRREESAQPNSEEPNSEKGNAAVAPRLTDALTNPDGPAMQALRSLIDGEQSDENAEVLPAPRPGYLAPLQPGSADPITPPTGSASLGVHVVPSESGTPGLEIASIGDHSLADEAGLRVGDTIVAMNDSPTYTAIAVSQQLQKLSVGDRVRVRFIRDGKAQQIEFPLVKFQATKPDPTEDLTSTQDRRWNPQMLGLEFSESPNRRGLVVSKVQPDSIAAAAGVKTGDRIVAMDGRLVSGIEAFERELSRLDSKSTASVKLVRGESLIVADLSTDRAATPKVASGDSASPLGGIGNVFNGLFGGSTPSADTETPPVDQADGAAQTNDASKVEQTGFESESKRMPLPVLENDPPSLRPVPKSEQQRQLAELKKREQEIRLELQRLQQQIKEIESKQ